MTTRGTIPSGTTLGAALLLAVTCSPVAAQWVVSQTGGGTHTTIQAAINTAQNGDDILVRPGTYVERVSFLGKTLQLHGENPDDPEIVDSTIIDGQAIGSVVTFVGSEGTGTVLEGLTLRNGGGANGGGINCSGGATPTIRKNLITSSNVTINGGGVYCAGGAAPRIQLNRITGNHGLGRGAGVFVENASPVIEANQISGNITIGSSGGGIHLGTGTSGALVRSNAIFGNSGLYGGGLHVEYAAPRIEGNHIYGNIGTPRGAGLSCAGGSPRIVNNIIAGNQSNLAAAMDLNGASPSVLHNTIIANRPVQAGIIVVANNSHPTLLGNIIAFHDFGFALQVVSGSSVNADNNCFFANTTGDHSGAVTVGPGNIYADPKIVTLGTWVNGQPPIGVGEDVEMTADLTGTTAAAGFAQYRIRPGRERLNVTVTSYPPNTNQQVLHNGLSIGQIFVNGSGSGELDYDTHDGTLPPNFPEVRPCDEIAVGQLASGELQIVGQSTVCTNETWQPGDEHLLANSPCRGAGPPMALTQLYVDRDGQLRPIGTGSDIGADEFIVPASGSFDGDQDVDLVDFYGFQNCFRSASGLICTAGDFDQNNQVLPNDYQQFRAAWSGP